MNTPALNESFAPAPCGCKIEAENEEQFLTEAGRAQNARNVEKLRDVWGCSGRQSDEFPPSQKHLTRNCWSVLAAVQRRTGFGADCTTCPLKYAAMPWVERAVIAWEFSERGELLAVEPHPLPILIEAVRLVGRGVAAARKEQHERDLAEMKRKRKPQK